MENLEQKIESVLFYLAEPVQVDFLVKEFDVDKNDILKAIGELGISLQKRGVRLLFNQNEVSLVTAPEYSQIIEAISKDEMEKDLGRSAIETLSIVAYKGPVSRKEIDYIRGVNSQFAVRSLLLRGLIEKKNNIADERIMMYNITSDALRYLGLSHISELPEYDEINKEIEKGMENNQTENEAVWEEE